jgi:plastocyanin
MRSFLVLGGAALALAAPAAAQAATKTVDMGTPLSAQKALNTKYLADANAFFPSSVKIHVGDSVQFVPTGFHNVDLPKKGAKPADLLAQSTPVTNSLDAAGAPFWFNDAVKNVGFNPAIIVGSLGKKVTFNGAKTVQSGLPLSAKPKPMTVKFTKAGTFTYYCDVHAGMKGTVTVVAASKTIPSAAQDKKAVAKQVAAATTVAKGLQTPTLPADTVTVGNAGKGGVEVYKFLPATLTVPHGTTVTFQMSAKTYEDHTATTGPGAATAETDPSTYIGKLAASFTAQTIDPSGAYPSDPPSAPATLTSTSHGNGFWNSGVMDVVAASPLPNAAKVTFGTPGTYAFTCLIHPFMHGTVIVT